MIPVDRGVDDESDRAVAETTERRSNLVATFGQSAIDQKVPLHDLISASESEISPQLAGKEGSRASNGRLGISLGSTQGVRMNLPNTMLKKDIGGVKSDDLGTHSFPTHLIEGERPLDHHVTAFVEGTDCLEAGLQGGATRRTTTLRCSCARPRCQ